MRTIRVQANENFVPRYQTTYLLPKFYYRAKPKPSLESLEPMQDFLVIGGWAERPLSHSFIRDPNVMLSRESFWKLAGSKGFTVRPEVTQ